MIGMVLAAALQAAAPSADGAAREAGDTASTLAELERIYADSCVNRAYGSFDDVCDAMNRQIGVYRKQLAREQGGRRAPTVTNRPAADPAPPTPAPASTSPKAGGAG